MIIIILICSQTKKKHFKSHKWRTGTERLKQHRQPPVNYENDEHLRTLQKYCKVNRTDRLLKTVNTTEIDSWHYSEVNIPNVYNALIEERRTCTVVCTMLTSFSDGSPVSMDNHVHADLLVSVVVHVTCLSRHWLTLPDASHTSLARPRPQCSVSWAKTKAPVLEANYKKILRLSYDAIIT